MCCCQKQLYIAKLAIAAACGGGAECALTANSQANCRRDVAILLYTAKPTARQGQGHCTLLWISRNTLKFLWKTKFSRRSHITWALISLKFASLAKFVPWFGLIFGLFLAFLRGQCTLRRLSLSSTRLQPLDAPASMAAVPKFLHIMALKVVNWAATDKKTRVRRSIMLVGGSRFQISIWNKTEN